MDEDVEMADISGLSDDEIIALTEQETGITMEDTQGDEFRAIAEIVTIADKALDEASEVSTRYRISSTASVLLFTGYIHGLYRTIFASMQDDSNKALRDLTSGTYTRSADLGQYHALVRRFVEIVRKRAQ